MGAPKKSDIPFGIIGAIDDELRALLSSVEAREFHRRRDQAFYEGAIGKQKVILAVSGVGKVNASCCTQFLLDHFKPRGILLVGIAGALKSIPLGDIVVPTTVTQHDFDLSGALIAKEEYRRWYQADAALLELAVKAGSRLGLKGHIHVGSMLTGDCVVASTALRQNLLARFPEGDCADMEAAAVAAVCTINETPFVILKAISDVANEESIQQVKQRIPRLAVLLRDLVCEMLGSAG